MTNYVLPEDIIQLIYDYSIGNKKYWKKKFNKSIEYINYLGKSFQDDNYDCNSFIIFIWDVIFVDLYFIGIFPPKKIKNKK